MTAGTKLVTSSNSVNQNSPVRTGAVNSREEKLVMEWAKLESVVFSGINFLLAGQLWQTWNIRNASLITIMASWGNITELSAETIFLGRLVILFVTLISSSDKWEYCFFVFCFEYLPPAPALERQQMKNRTFLTFQESLTPIKTGQLRNNYSASERLKVKLLMCRLSSRKAFH